MANKVVILAKGQSEGREITFDVDTGTNLRSLCHEGANQFRAARDPNVVAQYRLDEAAGQMKRLGQATIGFTTEIYGMACDGQTLFTSLHVFRSGTHTDAINTFRKGLVATIDQKVTDTGAADLGNRVKGIDVRGPSVYFIYSNIVSVLQRKRVFHSPPTANDYWEDFSLGNGGYIDIALEKQGDGYWLLASGGTLEYRNGDNTVVETFTLVNSGTPRGICDLGDGRLAISMT
jgi:hypothetical protein